MKIVNYLDVLGSLQYLATTTHPDLAYPGTLDYAITYAPDPNSSELLTTFSDADHGRCKDTG
ncbi:hypothetical protein PAXINDRAFT_19646 [Paxillus involutus ATCC 200175]|uniref:Uncharacterized protein n=1 Tax=Paxillus involutus ATCC 200175 TaxID=664439 RepID=A0A0C9SWI6_PAXIN|nr:hypothetical protein PAXINDRAFT_19646 [Paxillus involutus ATCC 200175]